MVVLAVLGEPVSEVNSRLFGKISGNSPILGIPGLKSGSKWHIVQPLGRHFPAQIIGNFSIRTGKISCATGTLRVSPARFLRGSDRLGKPVSLQNFMSSNVSKDGAGFAETARLIAGKSPPQWLAKHLQRWSSSVMLDGAVHANQIGKAEARARLKKLSHAIELVDREIRDPVVVKLLLSDEMGPLPTIASVDALLRELRRRADIVSSRLNLLGTGLDERFEGLSDAAGVAIRELQNPEISDFLRAEQSEPPPADSEFGAVLEEIRRQAEAALLSSYLATRAGQTKAGRGRALPRAASSPRAFCAAVILEALAHFHDAIPPAWDLQLAATAEEYWHVCGGTTNSWSGNPLNAWRPYFEEASEDSLAKTREDLRRHILESSAHKR